ncbi:hypothetical protein AMTRI_Chr12g270870 [Amborella trichopoda]
MVLVSLVTSAPQMVLVSLIVFIKIDGFDLESLSNRIGATVYNFISCAKAGGKCVLLCLLILVRNPIT